MTWWALIHRDGSVSPSFLDETTQRHGAEIEPGMASHETKSDKMEIHWIENDGRTTMVWAERVRPRRISLERILSTRGAVTAPMAVPFRRNPLRVAAVALLLGVLVACIAGLLR